MQAACLHSVFLTKTRRGSFTTQYQEVKTPCQCRASTYLLCLSKARRHSEAGKICLFRVARVPDWASAGHFQARRPMGPVHSRQATLQGREWHAAGALWQLRRPAPQEGALTHFSLVQVSTNFAQSLRFPRVHFQFNFFLSLLLNHQIGACRPKV
jgi:hypothetical protein